MTRGVPDVVQPCGFDRGEVVLGDPGRPVVLEHGQDRVVVDVLPESVLIDDVRVVEALEEARCYPGLVEHMQRCVFEKDR